MYAVSVFMFERVAEPRIWFHTEVGISDRNASFAALYAVMSCLHSVFVTFILRKTSPRSLTMFRNAVPMITIQQAAACHGNMVSSCLPSFVPLTEINEIGIFVVRFDFLNKESMSNGKGSYNISDR